MRLKLTMALIGVLALAAPASTGAHVTLQPPEATAGDFTALDVRVPNESADTPTTKVEVQFPAGFIFALYQPVPGWSVKVQMKKPAKPITSNGEKITEQVGRITWTADDDSAAVQPGQFIDFPVAVQISGKAGDVLTFKALQTYGEREVVRWIGGPESETPAPQVTITEGDEGHHDEASDSDETESDDTEGASEGLGIAALIIGALGLLAAAAALARSRRRA